MPCKKHREGMAKYDKFYVGTNYMKFKDILIIAHIHDELHILCATVCFKPLATSILDRERKCKSSVLKINARMKFGYSFRTFVPSSALL